MSKLASSANAQPTVATVRHAQRIQRDGDKPSMDSSILITLANQRRESQLDSGLPGSSVDDRLECDLDVGRLEVVVDITFSCAASSARERFGRWPHARREVVDAVKLNPEDRVAIPLVERCIPT
jgi:hypothetical protein